MVETNRINQAMQYVMARFILLITILVKSYGQIPYYREVIDLDDYFPIEERLLWGTIQEKKEAFYKLYHETILESPEENYIRLKRLKNLLDQVKLKDPEFEKIFKDATTRLRQQYSSSNGTNHDNAISENVVCSLDIFAERELSTSYCLNDLFITLPKLLAAPIPPSPKTSYQFIIDYLDGGAANFWATPEWRIPYLQGYLQAYRKEFNYHNEQSKAAADSSAKKAHLQRSLELQQQLLATLKCLLVNQDCGDLKSIRDDFRWAIPHRGRKKIESFDEAMQLAIKSFNQDLKASIANENFWPKEMILSHFQLGIRDVSSGEAQMLMVDIFQLLQEMQVNLSNQCETPPDTNIELNINIDNSKTDLQSSLQSELYQVLDQNKTGPPLNTQGSTRQANPPLIDTALNQDYPAPPKPPTMIHQKVDLNALIAKQILGHPRINQEIVAKIDLTQMTENDLWQLSQQLSDTNLSSAILLAHLPRDITLIKKEDSPLFKILYLSYLGGIQDEQKNAQLLLDHLFHDDFKNAHDAIAQTEHQTFSHNVNSFSGLDYSGDFTAFQNKLKQIIAPKTAITPSPADKVPTPLPEEPPPPSKKAAKIIKSSRWGIDPTFYAGDEQDKKAEILATYQSPGSLMFPTSVGSVGRMSMIDDSKNIPPSNQRYPIPGSKELEVHIPQVHPDGLILIPDGYVPTQLNGIPIEEWSNKPIYDAQKDLWYLKNYRGDGLNLQAVRGEGKPEDAFLLDQQVRDYYLNLPKHQLELPPDLEKILSELKAYLATPGMDVESKRWIAVFKVRDWILFGIKYSSNDPKTKKIYDTYLKAAIKDPRLNITDLALMCKKGDCDIGNALLVTILNQELQIPARLRSGYLGSKGFVINSSAHASAQFWSPEMGGWMTIDATPGEIEGDKLDYHRKSFESANMIYYKCLMRTRGYIITSNVTSEKEVKKCLAAAIKDLNSYERLIFEPLHQIPITISNEFYQDAIDLYRSLSLRMTQPDRTESINALNPVIPERNRNYFKYSGVNPEFDYNLAVDKYIDLLKNETQLPKEKREMISFSELTFLITNDKLDIPHAIELAKYFPLELGATPLIELNQYIHFNHPRKNEFLETSLNGNFLIDRDPPSVYTFLIDATSHPVTKNIFFKLFGTKFLNLISNLSNIGIPPTEYILPGAIPLDFIADYLKNYPQLGTPFFKALIDFRVMTPLQLPELYKKRPHPELASFIWSQSKELPPQQLATVSYDHQNESKVPFESKPLTDLKIAIAEVEPSIINAFAHLEHLAGDDFQQFWSNLIKSEAFKKHPMMPKLHLDFILRSKNQLAKSTLKDVIQNYPNRSGIHDDLIILMYQLLLMPASDWGGDLKLKESFVNMRPYIQSQSAPKIGDLLYELSPLLKKMATLPANENTQLVVAFIAEMAILSQGEVGEILEVAKVHLGDETAILSALYARQIKINRDLSQVSPWQEMMGEKVGQGVFSISEIMDVLQTPIGTYDAVNEVELVKYLRMKAQSLDSKKLSTLLSYLMSNLYSEQAGPLHFKLFMQIYENADAATQMHIANAFWQSPEKLKSQSYRLLAMQLSAQFANDIESKNAILLKEALQLYFNTHPMPVQEILIKAFAGGAATYPFLKDKLQLPVAEKLMPHLQMGLKWHSAVESEGKPVFDRKNNKRVYFKLPREQLGPPEKTTYFGKQAFLGLGEYPVKVEIWRDISKDLPIPSTYFTLLPQQDW